MNRAVGQPDTSLLEAIYSAPSDDGARLVYADYLMERANPLGEFIQLQVRRAAAGLRTKSREQALFKLGSQRWPPGSAWWPGSPCLFGRQAFNRLKWEHTSRGFPVVFDPGAMSSKAEANRELQLLVGNPAWNLVEGMTLWDWWPRPIVRNVLDGSRWMSLRSLSAEPELLNDVAKSDAASRVSVLKIIHGRDLPTLDGLGQFSAVRALSVHADLAVEGVIAALHRGQTPEGLRSLNVLGDDSQSTLQSLLRVFRELPFPLDLLSGRLYQLRGGRPQPDLRVAAREPDAVAAELSATPANAVGRVEIDVTVLPPKKRKAARAQLANATKKWGDRVTFVEHGPWWAP